tara:strand:+ start:85 stop:312 length:228 start_codon:yes stop_codon:yes gene_type:complete
MDFLNYLIIILVILTKQVNTRSYFKSSDQITGLFQKFKTMENEIQNLKDDYLEEDDSDYQENENDGERYEFKGHI